MTRHKLLEIAASAALTLASGALLVADAQTTSGPKQASRAPVGDQAGLPAPDDDEAFRPDPDAEATKPAVAGAEATKPRADTEAPTQKEDPEAFKPVPDFENERPKSRDEEAFKPRPGFEETKAVERSRDSENAAPDPAAASRLTPKVPDDETGKLRLAVGKNPLARRVVIQGKAREIDANLWTVEQARAEPLTFQSLIPRKATAAALAGAPVRATAITRPMPNGMLEGIAIDRQGGLLYLAEVVKDLAPLTPADRRGFVVTQVTTKLGEPVAEGPCHKTYEVPVNVTRAGESVQLAAGATTTLGGYRVNVLRSRYAVEQSCAYSFEEPVHDIEYVIWKP